MNLDPAMMDKFADLLARRVIAALADHDGDGDGDGAPGDLVDAEGVDHESGIGPAFTPEVIGGGPRKPGGAGAPPGAAPDAKDGEPVLDDLDADDGVDEGTDEGEDMGGNADEKDEKYGSGCATEPAATDAKRAKYSSDAEIDRAIGQAIDGVRVKYESDLRAATAEIAALKAEREAERRRATLESLQREGYEFSVENEMKRVQRYSAGGFDGHVELIRENYRKSDPTERSDFIPVGTPVSADDDGPETVAEMLRIAEENDITGGDPVEVAKLVYSKWNAAKRAAR